MSNSSEREINMKSKKMIKLNKSQAKALYAAIEAHCLKNGYSPYSFGYAAGVSHNYVYRLKDARSTSYNGMAIKRIVNALGSDHLEDVLNPKVKPQQKDKPKVEVVVEQPTCAEKYDSLPDEDKVKITALTNLLYDKKLLREQIQRRMEMIFKD